MNMFHRAIVRLAAAAAGASCDTNSDELVASVELIDTQGFTTLHNILPNVEKTILKLSSSVAPIHPSAALLPPIQERSHISYLSSSSSVALVTSLLEPLRPLLDNFFEGRGYRMSELQVITAPPNGTGQIFHRDQYDVPGLTLILPLCAVNARNGGTQLLARTHKPISFFSTPFDMYTLAGTIGDVCVMDSRVIHRGGANTTDKARTVLIVRFDIVGAAVPKNRGFGEIGKVLYVRLCAKALEIIDN